MFLDLCFGRNTIREASQSWKQWLSKQIHGGSLYFLHKWTQHNATSADWLQTHTKLTWLQSARDSQDQHVNMAAAPQWVQFPVFSYDFLTDYKMYLFILRELDVLGRVSLWVHRKDVSTLSAWAPLMIKLLSGRFTVTALSLSSCPTPTSFKV